MVRLIQITDCHLLANSESKFQNMAPYATLQSVCQDIYRKYQNIDAIVVTGDISQDSSPESYDHFSNVIAKLKKPVYVLPGNHDDIDTMRTRLIGCNSNSKPIEFGNWLLLRLNSQKQTYVEGWLNDAEFDKLEEHLTKSPVTNIILAVHHHPYTSGSRWMDRIGLKNGQQLMRLLSHHPRVRLLIHGHTHQVNLFSNYQFTCYGTPSSWRQFKPLTETHQLDSLPPAYRVLQLADNGSHQTWVEFVTPEPQKSTLDFHRRYTL